jgi:hypothetical protein
MYLKAGLYSVLDKRESTRGALADRRQAFVESSEPVVHSGAKHGVKYNKLPSSVARPLPSKQSAASSLGAESLLSSKTAPKASHPTRA